MTNPELAELAIRVAGSENLTEVSPVDRYVWTEWARKVLNVWLPATMAHREGMLSEETYESIFDDVRLNVESHSGAGVTIWKELLDGSPSLADTELVLFIRRRLNERQAQLDSGVG